MNFHFRLIFRAAVLLVMSRLELLSSDPIYGVHDIYVSILKSEVKLLMGYFQ